MSIYISKSQMSLVNLVQFALHLNNLNFEFPQFYYNEFHTRSPEKQVIKAIELLLYDANRKALYNSIKC